MNISTKNKQPFYSPLYTLRLLLNYYYYTTKLLLDVIYFMKKEKDTLFSISREEQHVEWVWFFQRFFFVWGKNWNFSIPEFFFFSGMIHKKPCSFCIIDFFSFLCKIVFLKTLEKYLFLNILVENSIW